MKKTCKIFSMFLAIIIVISALPISASAADVAFTVTSSVNDIKVGDTVTISINITENSQYGAFVGDIIYDSNVLEFVPYSDEDITFNGVGVVYNANVAGVIRIAFASENPITAGGVLLDVNFIVKETACNTVSLDIVESLDNDFNSISTTAVPVKLHSYGDWSTITESVCETAGQKGKSCTCGDTITESIDALGHDYATEFTTDSKPTCTETGSKSQHCSRCDSKQNVTEIPATGHNFGDWTTEIEPTCVKAGKENRVCSVCKETETQEIPATGHTEEEIPAVNPTCTETGFTAGVKCSVCDEVLTAQTIVLVTGHDYKEEITKIPTHTENGEKTFTCDNCGDTYTDTIEADGEHKYISDVTKEATCTEKGVLTFTCACNDEYTEEIPALGHTSADAVEENYVAPDCTDNGSKDLVVYCSVCNTELSRETEKIDAIGHTEEEIPAANPTCTDTGLTAGVKCSVCDEVLTAQTVVPATGHTEKTLSAVAPTCTATGLTAGVECSVCGEVLTAQTVVPATGHTEKTLSAVAPTCTATGLTAGTECSVCNEVLVEQVEVPANGHNDDDNDGYCDSCDEKLCDHICHKSGILGFFWKIANFFNRIFGMSKYCDCGTAHY